jgi:hypothetical protein
LKRMSDKRKEMLAAAKEDRDDLRAKIKGCEFCEKRAFALHEIPRAGVRSYVIGLPSCVLGLCDPGCHQRIGDGWPKAKQLALLKIKRPESFDLDVYNRWAVARVTDEDVAAWLEAVRYELAFRLN